MVSDGIDGKVAEMVTFLESLTMVFGTTSTKLSVRTNVC